MKKLLLLFCCISIGIHAQDVSLNELVNKKQFSEVIAYADQLTPADSADFEKMYVFGQAYEGLLQHKKAYAFYQRCFALDTTNTDMLNTLARVAINMGRAKDAQNYFHRVLERDSTNFYSNYQLARLYQQQGETEKAVDIYTYLRQWDENNPTLLKNIGDCYLQMKAIQAASLAYYIAFCENKENVQLASSLINICLGLQDDQQVCDPLAVCDTALYYNPGNKLLRQNKGMILYVHKMYAQADTIYSALIAEGDSSYLTLKYAGSSMYYAGQALRSIDPLTAAYEMDTTSVEVNLLLGSALGKTYDRKQAYVHLNKAEEAMQPHSVFIRNLLKFRFETLVKDQKRDEAVKLFYTAWKDEEMRKKIEVDQFDLLSHIVSLYSVSHVDNYMDEATRQKGIFIRYLYIKSNVEKKLKGDELLFYNRYFFESVYNDMFFRNVKEIQVLAPDGKKSKISAQQIKDLIDLLPEMPEKERKQLDEYQEVRKKAKQRMKV